jgi:hypothetical protein
MMEFEGLQRIWDAPSNQHLFMLDEAALHQRILTKNKKTQRVARFTELLLIFVNAAAGCFIFAMRKGSAEILLVVLASWMWLTALYMVFSHLRRLRSERRFDRTLLGSLQHALATATYQVRISALVLWNNLLVLLYCVFMILQTGKSLWYAVGLGIFFLIAWRAASWEQRLYKNRRRELEQLLHKLQLEKV